MSQLSGKMHWPTAESKTNHRRNQRERVGESGIGGGKAFKNVAALEMWLCQPEK